MIQTKFPYWPEPPRRSVLPRALLGLIRWVSDVLAFRHRTEQRLTSLRVEVNMLAQENEKLRSRIAAIELRPRLPNFADLPIVRPPEPPVPHTFGSLRSITPPHPIYLSPLRPVMGQLCQFSPPLLPLDGGLGEPKLGIEETSNPLTTVRDHFADNENQRARSDLLPAPWIEDAPAAVQATRDGGA